MQRTPALPYGSVDEDDVRRESSRGVEAGRWRRRLDSPAGQYAIVALLTLLAAALRFYKMGEWSFWIDELYTIRRALTQTELPQIIDRWPPFTTLLIGGALRYLGVSEWSARLVPALIGVLSVPALYFPLRRMVGHRTALIAAFLLTISPWHLFWSQNARFYTALMLVYALASLAFFFALEQNRRWLMAVFYVLLVIAFRERYLALLMVPVVLSYLLLLVVLRFEPPPGLRWRTLGTLILGGVALVLYDAYSLLWKGYSQLLAVTTLEFVDPVEDPFRLGLSIAFAIGIPLVSLALFAGIQSVVQKSRAGLFLLLGALVPVCVLLVANPFIFTKERYAFVALPSWIVLGALAVTQARQLTRAGQPLVAAGVAAVLAGDAAAANLLYYRINNGNRLDWKGAFAEVRTRSLDDDVFVGWWPDFGPHYAGREVVAWRELSPESVVRSGRRYWFVLDSETIWGNARMKQWVEENGDLIDVRYLRTPADAALRVYLYDATRPLPPQ